MIDPVKLAQNLAAELSYSAVFLINYVAGVAAKMHGRPFMYDTESGMLTTAGARVVRHQLMERHAAGVLRTYESDWLTARAARA